MRTPTPAQRVVLMCLYLPAHRLVLRHDGYRPGWIIEDQATHAQIPPRPFRAQTIRAIQARGWVSPEGWLTPAGRTAIEEALNVPKEPTR